MLPPPNFFTQLFVSQTCHNSTKKVSFSFSRPQARSNNIGQIPVERRQCCLLFSLHSRATVNTSIIEVLATVVLRCFDKDATEELYLINLLTFDIDSQEALVDRWKGRVACWELALKELASTKESI